MISFVAHALEHRDARAQRQAVDGEAQVLERRGAATSHRVRGSVRPTVGVGKTMSCAMKGSLRLKLGVHIGYWGLGLTREDQLEIVQEAERLGYDSVWTAEAYGSDAATILALARRRRPRRSSSARRSSRCPAAARR